MFGIIQRRVLRRGSFTCADELIKKMYDYMIWHNQSSQPFRWSYRPKSWSANQDATHSGPNGPRSRRGARDRSNSRHMDLAVADWWA